MGATAENTTKIVFLIFTVQKYSNIYHKLFNEIWQK